LTTQRDRDIAMLESLLAEWGEGDFSNGEPFTEDVVFVVAGPDGAEHHGIENFGRAWGDWLSAWSNLRMTPERVVAGEAGAYVLLHGLSAKGKGSGLDVDARVATLVHTRDGLVTRVEMYWDRDAALAAAGVAADDG
jgi:ketosteroid isomerase-like protein